MQLKIKFAYLALSGYAKFTVVLTKMLSISLVNKIKMERLRWNCSFGNFIYKDLEGGKWEYFVVMVECELRMLHLCVSFCGMNEANM